MRVLLLIVFLPSMWMSCAAGPEEITLPDWIFVQRTAEGSHQYSDPRLTSNGAPAALTLVATTQSDELWIGALYVWDLGSESAEDGLDVVARYEANDEPFCAAGWQKLYLRERYRWDLYELYDRMSPERHSRFLTTH